jgi:DNA polymerase-1
MRELQRIFNDTRTAKIAHNFKYEYAILDKEGIHIPDATVWHDTMLLGQLLNNKERSHSLEYLTWLYAGYSTEIDKQVRTQAKKRGNRYDKVDRELFDKYQIADGERPLILFACFHDEIKKDEKLYRDYLNEIQMVKTTHRMEKNGMRLDWKESDRIRYWLETELAYVSEETEKLFGERINLNSPKQLEKLLFEKLQFPPLRYNEKTGAIATDKTVIAELKERYEHPIFELIQKARSYKAGAGYIRSYQEYADKHGYIHPNINTNGTDTGRQSCNNPNMQNVEKDKGGAGNPFPVPARRCFIPPKRHVLYLVDYAGIELRLIIEVAHSKAMMQVLKNGGNPHIVACKLFGLPECPHYREYQKQIETGNITQLGTCKKDCGILYNYAKNGHFCLAYGGGVPKFADTLHIPEKQAQRGFERYKEVFPEIGNLTKSISEFVKLHGYAETPFGRKLRVPVEKSYMGLNYLIQGTAAGILKRAQVRLDEYIYRTWSDAIKMQIPIHDELILAIPRSLLLHADAILNDMSNIMTDIHEIHVPLEVEWKKTRGSWADAKNYHIQ